jgi:hypothetical protein
MRATRFADAKKTSNIFFSPKEVTRKRARHPLKPPPLPAEPARKKPDSTTNTTQMLIARQWAKAIFGAPFLPLATSTCQHFQFAITDTNN